MKKCRDCKKAGGGGEGAEEGRGIKSFKQKTEGSPEVGREGEGGPTENPHASD